MASVLIDEHSAKWSNDGDPPLQFSPTYLANQAFEETANRIRRIFKSKTFSAESDSAKVSEYFGQAFL